MYFDVAGVGYCKKGKKPNFLSNIWAPSTNI